MSTGSWTLVKAPQLQGTEPSLTCVYLLLHANMSVVKIHRYIKKLKSNVCCCCKNLKRKRKEDDITHDHWLEKIHDWTRWNHYKQCHRGCILTIRCHIVLVMSFGTRVFTAVIGDQSRSIEVLLSSVTGEQFTAESCCCISVWLSCITEARKGLCDDCNFTQSSWWSGHHSLFLLHQITN